MAEQRERFRRGGTLYTSRSSRQGLMPIPSLPKKPPMTPFATGSFTRSNPLTLLGSTSRGGAVAHTSYPKGQVVFDERRPAPPPSTRSMVRRREAAEEALSSSAVMAATGGRGGAAAALDGDDGGGGRRGKGLGTSVSFVSRDPVPKTRGTEEEEGGGEGGGRRRAPTSPFQLPRAPEDYSDPLYEYCASLERMLKRVSNGMHTRECSEDLVKFASQQEEPFCSEYENKNPWVVNLNEDGEGKGNGCCVIA